MRLEGSGPSQRQVKRLRREMTPPEIGLWLALRRNDAGLRFRRQYPAGDYVIDFYCAPSRLAIEVDGEAHSRGDRPATDGGPESCVAAEGTQRMRLEERMGGGD